MGKRVVALALLLVYAINANAALTFFWRGESTTFSGTDDFSAGDSTPTGNAAVSVGSAAGMVGTNGIIVSGAADHYRFDTSTSVFPIAAGAAGFLIRYSTWPGNSKIWSARGSSPDYSYSIYTGATSDTLVAYLGNPEGAPLSAQTSSLGLSADTVYGVVFRWDDAADTFRIEIYSDPLGAPTLIEGVSNTTGWTTFADFAATDRFRMGEDTGNGVAFHMDNIFVGDTYAEPIEDNFGITSYTGYGGGSGATQVHTLQNLGKGLGPHKSQQLGGHLD